MRRDSRRRTVLPVKVSLQEGCRDGECIFRGQESQEDLHQVPRAVSVEGIGGEDGDCGRRHALPLDSRKVPD